MEFRICRLASDAQSSKQVFFLVPPPLPPSFVEGDYTSSKESYVAVLRSLRTTIPASAAITGCGGRWRRKKIRNLLAVAQDMLLRAYSVHTQLRIVPDAVSR